MRILAIILLFISLHTHAQVSGEWIQSGDFKLRVNADGQLATYNNSASSEMTPGSNNHLFKFINLWISGNDSGGKLRISTTNAYTHKCDFSQGPTDSLSYKGADPLDWNHVWFLTSQEIKEHQKNFRNANYNPIDAIKNWPANGSGKYYKYLAPFIDYNQDGMYDPLDGDYPDILGNQINYFIINDNKSEHKASGGIPLKIEIYGMLYTLSNIPNTVFAKYFIINRTDKDFSNIKVSMHTAFELGNSKDNYCGSLVNRNLVFAYNGDDNDDNHFGLSKPIASIFSLDKDFSSVIYITNDTNSQTGMPVTPKEHRNMMEGKWKSGKPLTFGNAGLDAAKAAGFVYPGASDPAFGSENWQENGTPGERGMLASMSFNDLKSKGFIELNFAIAGFQKSNDVPYSFLDHKSSEIKNAWMKQVLNTKSTLNTQKLSIKNPVQAGEEIFEPWFVNYKEITVFNDLGQAILTMNTTIKKELILSKKGIYYIRFISDTHTITKKIFII